MDDELRFVHKHMQAFGLCALAHANYHANTHNIYNVAWNQLSVIQAAHAAEILIKARIAQEHPLLIFEQFPKSKKKLNRKLELKDLFENGRTFQFSDLPEKLWASTGIVLPNVEKYHKFGRLRNTVQHFTFPEDRDLSQETLDFIFTVIDPFINSCWGLYAIDFNEDHEPYAYFAPNLIARKIIFLASEGFIDDLEKGELSWHGMDWPERDNSYTKVMKKRIKDAQKLFRPNTSWLGL